MQRERELQNQIKRAADQAQRDQQVHQQELLALRRNMELLLHESDRQFEELKNAQTEVLKEWLVQQQQVVAPGQPPVFAMLPRDTVIEATHNFDDESYKIGGGAFSSVYRVDTEKWPAGALRASEVVIKKFSIPSDLSDERRIKLKADLLKMAEVEHVNVLPLLGLSSLPTCAIYPWMANGSLQKHMNDDQLLDWKLRVSSRHFLHAFFSAAPHLSRPR